MLAQAKKLINSIISNYGEKTDSRLPEIAPKC